MEIESESRTVEARLDELDINKSNNSQDDSENGADNGHETTNASEMNVSGTDLKLTIVKEDVTLPRCSKKKLAFVVYNVFSKEECEDYIMKTEKMGYTEALVNVGFGRQKLLKDVRNNTRCIWDSFDETDRIWQRIKKYIPTTWADRKVCGLNARLRFLKYDPGEYFAPHMDGTYVHHNGDRSYLTIQLYLNEGFEGGSTTFMNAGLKERHEVIPKTGMVLVFQHDIMHEGSKLIKGRKYSMRTDVMYAAKST